MALTRGLANHCTCTLFLITGLGTGDRESYDKSRVAKIVSLFDELRYVVPRPFGVFLANLNCSNISTYAIPGIPIDQQCKNFPRLCEFPYNNTGTEDVVSWHLQVVFITMILS